MSASLIFDLAPIGSLVSWSDGKPRPPERFHKKLAAWQTRNSQGRLIREEGPRKLGSYTSPGYFTLHQEDIGGKSMILVTLHRTFGLDLISPSRSSSARRSARCASSTAPVKRASCSISPKTGRLPRPGCGRIATRAPCSRR
ncbi:hypothetical protein [Aminobacter sp. SR38]|uniref:hypothetical protein n=1 Tax=Aminobacter sp. SR38 TaxID=2774562 RepID=UPI00352C8D85